MPGLAAFRVWYQLVCLAAPRRAPAAAGTDTGTDCQQPQAAATGTVTANLKARRGHTATDFTMAGGPPAEWRPPAVTVQLFKLRRRGSGDGRRARMASEDNALVACQSRAAGQAQRSDSDSDSQGLTICIGADCTCAFLQCIANESIKLLAFKYVYVQPVDTGLLYHSLYVHSNSTCFL